MKPSIVKQLFIACITRDAGYKLTLRTRDQILSEQYHRGNIKTSEIHWGTSAIQNFSRGDLHYQYTPGRLKIQTFFTED